MLALKWEREGETEEEKERCRAQEAAPCSSINCLVRCWLSLWCRFRFSFGCGFGLGFGFGLGLQLQRVGPMCLQPVNDTNHTQLTTRLGLSSSASLSSSAAAASPASLSSPACCWCCRWQLLWQQIEAPQQVRLLFLYGLQQICAPIGSSCARTQRSTLDSAACRLQRTLIAIAQVVKLTAAAQTSYSPPPAQPLCTAHPPLHILPRVCATLPTSLIPVAFICCMHVYEKWFLCIKCSS